LKHVTPPIEISPVVMIQQQMKLRRVNMVIQQAGLKIKLNQEILDRQEQCNRKALVVREIENRFAKATICEEVKSKVKLVKAQSTKVKYNNVVKELEQRYRYKEIVKEIKVRQKQIFWKGQTCIIIKQGGNKIRVNQEIRSIARQKFLKKQINTLIKQGGLKSRVQKEIRHLRRIAALKRQKELKAKVNKVIRAMARAQKEERLMNIIVNQSNWKAICNEEIREGLGHPLCPVRKVQPKQMQMSQDIRESNDSVATWLDTMSDDSEDFVSDEGIAIMKLVESVTRVSETREKQEKVIRKLTQEITQQRADFVALNKRVVDDKKQLYRKLEDLMHENELLKKTLMKQTIEEKLMKSLAEARMKNTYYQNHRQIQQTPMLYQEMQELGSRKMAGTTKSFRFQEGSFKQREAIPGIQPLL